MRICFMGTPDFALPALNALHKENEIIAVFTQPDKPKGRGNKLSPSPVKKRALELNLPVYQPVKVRDKAVLAMVEELQPHIIVVVAYGQILPQKLLDIPVFGAINIHGSLLPKYRGAAPIQWAVINGELTTGVTIMQMDKDMDTGDIILTEEISIENNTSGEVFEKLSVLGAEAVIKALTLIKSGVSFQKQDNTKATYAPILTKEMAEIDWHKTTKEILNLIRGLNPWPVAHTVIEGRSLKIWKAGAAEYRGYPGEIIKADPKNGLIIATKDGAVYIEEIQGKGGKRMKGKEYLRGNSFGNRRETTGDCPASFV